MFATIAYGAHKYKTAKHVMSTSNFLMQLRVAAQTCVIGCMALGMIYNLGKNALGFKDDKKN